MKRLFGIFRSAPLLSTAFLLGLCVTAYFAISTISFAVYWADPAHRDLALKGWMTPGYVAHSWHVPRHVMQEAIQDMPDKKRPTLEDIAKSQGIQLEVLITRIQAAIIEHRQVTDS